MYQIVMKDGRIESFVHPTVSTVTGDTRHVWQLVDDVETQVAEFPTAEIAATVDCQHTEMECPCMQAVMERLHPPEVDPRVRAAQKLKSVAGGQGPVASPQPPTTDHRTPATVKEEEQ